MVKLCETMSMTFLFRTNMVVLVGWSNSEFAYEL